MNDFRKLLNKIHVNGLTLPRATEKLGPPTERISLLGAYESFQSQKNKKQKEDHKKQVQLQWTPGI